jgi:hypothetical protein
MLPEGEAQRPRGIIGEPLIVSHHEIILDEYFLPSAPDQRTKNIWGSMEEARADRGIGYVSRQDAKYSGCMAPFTEDEEKTLARSVNSKSTPVRY